MGEGRMCRTSQDVCQHSPHLQLEGTMLQVGVCTSFGGNQQFKPLRNLSEEAVLRVKFCCKFREHLKVDS